jgi:Uma2 family endonuclease
MITIGAPLWRFTVKEFVRMSEVGIFREDERLELVDGLVLECHQIGERHGSAVNRGNRILGQFLEDRAIVSVRGPVQIGESSLVQPDIAVLRPRHDYYASEYPQAEDALLLIEVADTSLQLDRSHKVPLYAREGVAEVWLVNLLRHAVEVFRRPERGAYRDQLVVERGAEITPLAFPDLRVRVDEIAGG